MSGKKYVLRQLARFDVRGVLRKNKHGGTDAFFGTGYKEILNPPKRKYCEHKCFDQ